MKQKTDARGGVRMVSADNEDHAHRIVATVKEYGFDASAVQFPHKGRWIVLSNDAGKSHLEQAASQ